MRDTASEHIAITEYLHKVTKLAHIVFRLGRFLPGLSFLS